MDRVIDQYQVSTDKRSGITSDPNREDDEEYIVRLVGRVMMAQTSHRSVTVMHWYIREPPQPPAMTRTVSRSRGGYGSLALLWSRWQHCLLTHLTEVNLLYR